MAAEQRHPPLPKQIAVVQKLLHTYVICTH